ncbi:hypothetical protein [Salinicola tamaricis]|uniref:hypothetical protein n=1 Tax=Salinicola tamaricis TaxID=1771309 RepID=UPI003BF4AA1C
MWRSCASTATPATPSAGWLGYSEEKMRHLCREALDEGWRHFKQKVAATSRRIAPVPAFCARRSAPSAP